MEAGRREHHVPGVTRPRANVYVRLGNFYANAALTLPQLARRLWDQLDQFLGSEGKAFQRRGRAERILPRFVMKAVRVSRLLSQFGWLRGDGRDGGDRLELNVAGDLAIVRRSGAIKVLDVDRRAVTTVVSNSGEREKLADRVEKSRFLAGLPFVPSLHEVDLERGFYVEEFVSGTHPLNFSGCRGDFAEVYRPLLVEFLTAFPPRWTDSREYLERLRSEILDPSGLLGRLEPESRQTVESFVEVMTGRLRGLSGPVPLVLSHGDFFSGNIVIDGERHLAIDWANVGFRSPLHDLYYLFMNHCWRVMEHVELGECARCAIGKLRAALAEKDPGVHEGLDRFMTTGAFWRWLFYLECVHVPITRCSDPADRYLTSMLERITWFREYEEQAASTDPNGGQAIADSEAEAVEAGHD